MNNLYIVTHPHTHVSVYGCKRCRCVEEHGDIFVHACIHLDTMICVLVCGKQDNKCRYTKLQIDRQTDRQRDGQAGRQAGRQGRRTD